jgi:hypothetical protein
MSLVGAEYCETVNESLADAFSASVALLGECGDLASAIRTMGRQEIAHTHGPLYTRAMKNVSGEPKSGTLGEGTVKEISVPEVSPCFDHFEGI